MHILLLGTSSDAGNWFENGRKRHEIAAERIEAEFGEPVTVTVKYMWPSERLPALVAGWVQETQPDLIDLSVPAFWVLHRSVPLRAQRLLGRFGPAVGKAGFRAAESKRWAHNRVFRGLRIVLQSTIGGDTHFTPDEVISRISDCLRISIQAEGAIVSMRGPQQRAAYSRTRRGIARDDRTRIKVHRALEALCKQLHVTYVGGEDHLFDKPGYGAGTTVGDGIHANAERHVFESDQMYARLRAALIAAGREPAPSAVPSPIDA